MMTTHEEETIAMTPGQEGEPRHDLEMEAKRAEGRLLATLEKVDRRRHRVQEEIAGLPGRLLVSIVAGGAVLGLLAVTLAARRPKPPAPISLGERWAALRRAWAHPDRVAPYASPQQDRGLARRVGAGALSAVASMLLSYLAKRTVAALVAADQGD